MPRNPHSRKRTDLSERLQTELEQHVGIGGAKPLPKGMRWRRGIEVLPSCEIHRSGCTEQGSYLAAWLMRSGKSVDVAVCNSCLVTGVNRGLVVDFVFVEDDA